MLSFSRFILKAFTYFFLPTFNMLCLSAWSSHDLSKASQTFSIPCYAKLGGKYVGELRICGSTSAYQVLQYIQVQASKMLTHTWRDFEDIMVWCTNQWLIPSGFAYRDDLTQEEEEQAWSAIQNAKRLEVMWDDNDEHANMVAQASPNNFFVENQTATFNYFVTNTILPREVVGLLKRSRVPRISFHKDPFIQSAVTTSLAFLKSTTITSMSSLDVLPTIWSDCTNIKELYISSFWNLALPLGIGCLRNLRYLQLDGVELLPQDFGDLNLVCFNLGQSKQLELSNLVPLLVKMPNLETLRYNNNRKTNTLIPTELGNLVSLKVLELRKNRFVGSIPSELGRLVNLTSLTIIEYADFDLTRPQEVLNLNLTELVVERPQEGW